MPPTDSANRMLARSGRLFVGALVLLAASAPAFGDDMRTVKGLATPESVIVTPDGRMLVSEIGEFGKDGDGKVTVVTPQGTLQPFATGLDDPKGLAYTNDSLYVADKTRLWKIDRQGRAVVFVKPEDFPQPTSFLNDLATDKNGDLYVSDSGDLEKGGNGAIFKVTPGGKVSLIVSEAQNPSIKSPNGLLFDGPGKLLVVDFATGELLRLDTAKGSTEKLAEGFGGGDGLARDAAGMVYISDWKNGRVWKLSLKQGAKPQRYDTPFRASADILVSPDGRFILVPDMKAGTLVWLPK